MFLLTSMHHITIDASQRQLANLRKGRKVRVKHGTGFNLIVKPENYALMTRSFGRARAVDIALDEEELEANQKLSEGLDDVEGRPLEGELEGLEGITGQGIFGHRFDKFVEKSIGKKNKQELYETAKMYKVPIQGAMNAAIATGAAALTAVQPELAPFIAPGAYAAGAYLTNYIDHPSEYQGEKNHKKMKGLAKNLVEAKIDNELNNRYGTNYGYMNRAGLDKMYSDQVTAGLSEAGFKQKYDDHLDESFPWLRQRSSGMYGSGFREGIQDGQYFHRERAHQPVRMYGRGMPMRQREIYDNVPALQSQPYSANFQFQYTLPHQLIGEGIYPMDVMSGHGLYVGHDGRGLRL